ncbi:probable lipoprotein aminopeptidase LpqL [Halichondria panicea]|uniref:probable lipoprotein aminopeptidase LpqL n=1 Tax=Halichondria panicea TaxID=6063 RepID=UPI00312BBAB5
MAENAKFGLAGGEVESDPLVATRQSQSFSYDYKSGSKNRTLWIVAVVVLVAVALVVVIGVAAGVTVAANSQAQLENSIKIENLMAHLKDLEDIAVANSNSRAVMYGYNESAEQVFEKLQNAGYTNLTRQYFKMATYENHGDHTLSAEILNYTFNFELGTQFNVMRYSGATGGVISGTLNIVTGCNESDFTDNTVALIDYSKCPSLFDVASAAKSAGVIALLMTRTDDETYRSSPPTARVYEQTADDFKVVDLPLLGTNYNVGDLLKDFNPQGDITVSLSVNMMVDFYMTYNILAYTDGGSEDSIIVVGSHLDSVPAGPGINDNGSGSMANLEIALQLIRRGTNPENKVLFAFWAAEEWGLMGSYHYVKSLPESAYGEIALNLNFDMIGSPNYIRQIYNGSDAENPLVREASITIQELFVERFKSLELPYKLTPFTGRSDYGPFIESGVDIPAGGLATGADETKTREDQLMFGGLAGAILDPCYHQYCDTTDNINQEVYEQMAQAAASVLNTLMMKDNLKGFLNPSEYMYDYVLEDVDGDI